MNASDRLYLLLLQLALFMACCFFGLAAKWLALIKKIFSVVLHVLVHLCLVQNHFFFFKSHLVCDVARWFSSKKLIWLLRGWLVQSKIKIKNQQKGHGWDKFLCLFVICVFVMFTRQEHGKPCVPCRAPKVSLSEIVQKMYQMTQGISAIVNV